MGTENQGKRLASEVVERIRRLAKEGRSSRAICKLVGVARNTAKKYLRDFPPPKDP